MSIYIATHNAVEDALSVAMTPAAAALFPVGYLYDGDSSLPAVFGALTANPDVIVDLSIMTGGGFEGASLAADGWTTVLTGTATAVRSTVEFDKGVASALLTPGTGVAQIYKDVTLRAGWTYAAKPLARALSGTPTAKAYLQDLSSGLYWSGTAWVAGSTPWLTGAAAVNWTTWTAAAGATPSVTAPTFLAAMARTVTCRYTLEASAGGTAIYWDTVDPSPYWDLISIHGHNIDPLMVVTVRSSVAGVIYLLEATLTKLQPSFYARLTTPSRARFAKLLCTGTPTVAPYIGELWISQLLTLSTGPDFGMRLTPRWPQIRNATRGGGQRVYAQALQPMRTIEINHRHASPGTGGSEAAVTAARLAAYQQVRDGVYHATRGGADPLVIITPDLDAEVCILGRIDPDLPTSQGDDRASDVRTTSLRVVEEPFPIVTS